MARASAFQAEGCGFDPRLPLSFFFPILPFNKHLRKTSLLTHSFYFAKSFFVSEGYSQAPDPHVTLPDDTIVFIGESFTSQAALRNTGDPGFGIYLWVTIPPGINFNSATWLGFATVTNNVGIFDPTTMLLTDPWSKDIVTGPANGRMLLIQPPINLISGQPDIVVDLGLTLAPTAILGTSYEISAVPIYRYGDTPTGDNGPIRGTADTFLVYPGVIKFQKSNNAHEEETATGPSFPVNYTVNVDIAENQLVNDVTIEDTLPASLHYKTGSINVTGATATDILTVPGAGDGGTIQVNIPSARGSISSNDIQITYQAYVPDILDHNICETGLTGRTAWIQIGSSNQRFLHTARHYVWL